LVDDDIPFVGRCRGALADTLVIQGFITKKSRKLSMISLGNRQGGERTWI
jgi:hypothetical protein